MSDSKGTLIFSSMAILIGGLGTRLRSVVPNVPKPMAPVNSIPFLHYVITYWANRGIKNIYLLSGYRGNVVKEYFENRFKKINIYIEQEKEPLGTGGAINLFLKDNKNLKENEFLAILNGDTWLDVNRQKLNQNLFSLNKEMLLICRNVDHNDRYGTLIIKNDQILDILEPNLTKAAVNAGLYIAQTDFWKKTFLNYKINKKFSFENVIIPELAQNYLLRSSMCVDEFLDIGIPEDYKKSTLLLNKETI
jgi:NDP-sugar pyrophosphorylase family protein